MIYVVICTHKVETDPECQRSHNRLSESDPVNVFRVMTLDPVRKHPLLY